MAKKLVLLLSCLAMLTGCLQTRMIDEMNLIQGAGYDYINGEKFRGTLAFPSFGRGEKTSKITPVTFTATAKTILGVHDTLQHESPKPLEEGRLLVMVFGNKLARKGIFELVDLFRRDPEFGRQLNLVVATGEAKQLLEFKYKGELTPPMYLSKLINHNMKRNLPTTNFHTFLYSYYGKGVDPFLPLVTIRGDHAKIAGLALFKNDRYVAKINQSNLFLFKLLYEDHGNGAYVVSTKKPEAEVSILEIRSHSKYWVSGHLNHPIVNIDVSLTGAINEWGELVNKKQKIPMIEKEAEREIQKKITDMVQLFKRKKVDPLGWGYRARTWFSGWTEKKWDSVYPDIEVNLNIDVNIVQEGTTR